MFYSNKKTNKVIKDITKEILIETMMIEINLIEETIVQTLNVVEQS